jgi:hypothetical protein
MSSPSPRSWVSVSAAGTEAKLSRSTAEGLAQGLAQHLNRVLNRTVSDSHLSVSPIDGDGDTFELTRLVERQNVPLQLRGTKASLFVRLLVVVEDGRCTTDSYEYRFQADESRRSWLRRWEYRREPPDADYPYSLAHVHVRGTSPDGAAIDREHIPAGGRAHPTPLEEIIRYLIADRGVKSKNKDWKAILEESEKTFHN